MMADGVIAAISDHQATPVVPIRMDANTFGNFNSIALAVHTYTGAPRTPTQQVGPLIYRVVASVYVKAEPQSRVAMLTGQVRGAGAIALEIAVVVINHPVVAINRIAKELAPIDVISHILQDGQFRFHEHRVITEQLMAHHAVLKLDVAHIVWIDAARRPEYAHGHPSQPALEHLIDIGSGEVSLVLSHIESGRIVLVRASLTQYLL